MKEKHIYLLHVWSDVEPNLLGPYTDEKRRDIDARRIRDREGEDCGGLYPVTLDVALEDMSDGVTHKLDVSTYCGAFFEDEDDRVCPGAASILIALSEGRIEIRHGDDGTVLARKDATDERDWERLWLFITEIWGAERTAEGVRHEH
jgi:hypothetical protein